MKTFVIFLSVLFLACGTLAQVDDDCTMYDDALCVGVEDGAWRSAPTSCTRWLQCADNAVFGCGTCPGGLYFSPELGGCTYPSQVDCEITGGAGACTPGVVSRVPHPESCTIYFQCLGQGQPIEHHCADGLQFDAVLEHCDIPDNVRCLREPLDVECPADTGNPFDNLPHPWVCDLFFICINGVAHEQQCLDGMHFDVDLKQCQVIADATCILDSNTEPGPEPEPEPDVVDRKMVKPRFLRRSDVHTCSQNSVYYLAPYPDNCKNYIQCIYGDANIMSCADGLLFDPVNLRCDVAANVNCA